MNLKFSFLFLVILTKEISGKSTGDFSKTWIEMNPTKSLPRNCVVGGQEGDLVLHIGRKQIDNELVIGKVIDSWKSGYCEFIKRGESS